MITYEVIPAVQAAQIVVALALGLLLGFGIARGIGRSRDRGPLLSDPPPTGVEYRLGVYRWEGPHGRNYIVEVANRPVLALTVQEAMAIVEGLENEVLRGDPMWRHDPANFKPRSKLNG